MRAQDIIRSVIKVSGKTQQQLAEELGKSSQGTISMMLQNKNMRIDNIVTLLNACDYEVVARSRDGARPEFVFGNDPGGMSNGMPSDMKLKELIRKVVFEELAKKENDKIGWQRVELPDDDLDVRK